MNKKQSGILGFLKKPKDTESVKLTAFRPDLPSPKPLTTKRKASELSSPNSTPCHAWEGRACSSSQPLFSYIN